MNAKNRTTMRVALAGNPNSGKTTVFNAMTGARQRVGNYPGVTVEKMEGRCRRNGFDIDVVDLPGIYGLSANSIEEVVARNYVLDERPDVLVVVVDASNLERNLYLPIELTEHELPMVLAFNMSDVAAARGIEINHRRLSKRLGVPIVPTVGHKGKGIDELLDAMLAAHEGTNTHRRQPVDYGRDVEHDIRGVEQLLAQKNGKLSEEDRRWLAVKLLEKDAAVRERVGSDAVLVRVDEVVSRMEARHQNPSEITFAERRYDYISRLCEKTVRKPDVNRRSRSQRIDDVLTHRIAGLPIFFALMYAVFHFTFTMGDPMVGSVEGFFGWLQGVVASAWPAGVSSPLQSLLIDGVIGGVGGVITFLPIIALLFIAIGLLESSGYMARAAFIMDRVMRKFGLHGQSFIPMLLGTGCSVPAIMATRTLENRSDRLTTMLVVPLISCSARLTIYLLIIPAFFPRLWQAPMLWSMYIIGIILAIVAARVLRSTKFKGQSSSFLMELPPYRMPTLKGVGVQAWQRSWLFLRKAGTLILSVSIVLWAMTGYPKKSEFDVDYKTQSANALVEYENTVGQVESGDAAAQQRINDVRATYHEQLADIERAQQSEQLAYSVAGRVGHAMEPVLRPMGFDWKIGTALIGSFAAKEVFVAQMAIVHSVGGSIENSEGLRAKLHRNYSPLVAFCIMLFTMISTPCVATIATTRRESNSWRWALFQLGALTFLAFALTAIVYQVGSLLGIGV